MKLSTLGLLGALSLLALPSAFARGVGAGGGGDTCEDRIKVIRDDLQSWIQKSGPADLTLPTGVSVEQYSGSMLSAIGATKLRCVGPNDEGFPVLVNGTPKICRFDQGDETGLITCDLAKFNSLGEADQYVLVHHEYAGMAGIEPPNGADSNYDVSNQISQYLVNVTVKKLAVKTARSERPLPDFDPFQKLEEGRRLHARSSQNIVASLEDVEGMRADTRQAQAELVSREPRNDAMLQVLQTCSEGLGEQSSYVLTVVTGYIANAQQEIDEALVALRSDVENFASAQNCSQCDAEVRTETLAKYKGRIEADLRTLDVGRWDREAIFGGILSDTRCDFNRFFAYDDSRSFKPLEHRNLVSYSATLSAGAILKGDYARTLSYLIEAGSVPVKRTASRFGSPSSEFKDGTVRIRVKYDYSFVTGYDGIWAPKLTNPIHIIQRDL
ncbi:MAG: hypothetical protein NDJ90_05275 [Oligoflexia bacterium]|nr:hypothetical protein [Oligoflexia bacterium]